MEFSCSTIPQWLVGRRAAAVVVQPRHRYPERASFDPRKFIAVTIPCTGYDTSAASLHEHPNQCHAFAQLHANDTDHIS